MKTLSKRFCAIFVTIVMTITLMSILSLNCFSDYYTVLENGIKFYYSKADCSKASVKDLVIPEMIDNRPVEEIVIKDNEIIETIEFPASVKKIEILSCPNVTQCSVNENNEYFCTVDHIIYSKDLTKLVYYPPSKEGKTFKIPDSVTEIGYPLGKGGEVIYISPFDSCKYLENIIFHDHLNYIGLFAFYNCKFEYIELPNNVSCCNEAFSGCRNLKEIVVSENFKSCAMDIFMDCDSLETAVFLRSEPFKDCFCSISEISWGSDFSEFDCIPYAFMFMQSNCPLINYHMPIYVPDEMIENYKYAIQCNYNFVPLSEKPKGEIGDVNNNGKIDVMDVVSLQKYLTGKRIPAGLNLDVNGDNAVNVFDLIALKRMVSELENTNS